MRRKIITNQAYASFTTKLLDHEAGFKRVAEVKGGEFDHWSYLDFWTGPKGLFICQVWKDGHGFEYYVRGSAGTVDEVVKEVAGS